MAQLTERDRNLLKNDIDKLTNDNKSLQDGIVSDIRQINNLTLYDIPFKKYLDEKHFQIFLLEEEARLLLGKNIIGPVQEPAFTINTTESDVKVIIADARFIVKKSTVTIVDVPLIDSRAYIVSTASYAGVIAGFDIWTRDRHGSATSAKNVPQSYRIHSGNNKFTMTIDSVTKSFNIVDPETLSAQGGAVVNDAQTLAGNIAIALESAGFTDAKCLYNIAIQTFTIASGTAGPSSTAYVVVESTSTDNIARQMKFSSQVNIPGRYANNKFTIAIDGVQKNLELAIDVRVPVSSSLGYALDDYSADWRQDFSAGPMFPAERFNGSKIASLIQSAIRDVGTGGYTNAECSYYSDSCKFIIYSGTFGANSIVEIKQSSDINRDLMVYLTFNNPTDQKSRETSYTTLQALYTYLNSRTIISCSNLHNPTYKTYSLLSILDGAPVTNSNLILQTTSEYDRAHINQPRLYSGKLRVDSLNNKLDTSAGTYTIASGDYSEGELCNAMQDVLGSTYTVQYKKSSQTFVITKTTSVTMYFNTGSNIATSIATYMGFLNTSDVTGTSFTSNPVSFSGVDFFSMAYIPQLYMMSWFNNQPPFYYAYAATSTTSLTIGTGSKTLTVSAIIPFSTGQPAVIVHDSSNKMTGLVTSYTGSTLVVNVTSVIGSGTYTSWHVNNLVESGFVEQEIVSLNSENTSDWLMIAAAELVVVNYELSVINQEIINYSITSTTDANYLNLVAAKNDAIVNINSLILFLSRATTSSTSLIIGTGSRTLTIGTGLSSFLVGEAVTIMYDSSNWMQGTITSYNSITGQLIVNVTLTNGSGTHASWQVSCDTDKLARQSDITARLSFLSTRSSQITSRSLIIQLQLSSLYSSRWSKVVNRLNKKSGSYFKVGEKELGIISSQQTIIENNVKIAQIQAMLGA